MHGRNRLQPRFREFVDFRLKLDRRDVHRFRYGFGNEVDDELARFANVAPRVFGAARFMTANTDDQNLNVTQYGYDDADRLTEPAVPVLADDPGDRPRSDRRNHELVTIASRDLGEVEEHEASRVRSSATVSHTSGAHSDTEMRIGFGRCWDHPSE